MPAAPKPEKSTPETRKAERQKRSPNPLKAQILQRERVRDQDQTPRVKADPAEANLYQVHGSSLKTISKKRLTKLGGKHLTSTFAPKAGQKRLARPRKIEGRVIRSVGQRTGLTPTGRLKVVGRRGKRLAPGDRKAAQAIKGLQCICGCCLPVQWGHLQRRNILSTRHEAWATAPVCEFLHPWLDRGKGVKCRRELFEKARELDRRLTHEDAEPILSRWGYYTMLADRRVVER